MGTVNVVVVEGDERKEIIAEAGQTVMESLGRHHIYMPAVCSGRGVCGKCTVRLAKGRAEATPEEKTVFSVDEIRSGYRLACLCRLWDDAEIIIEGEKDFAIQAAYEARVQERAFQPRVCIKKMRVSKENASLSSQLEALFHGRHIGLRVMRKMAGLINDSGDGLFDKEEVYVLADDGHVLDIYECPAVTPLGLAIDIGTTTLCFEVVDLLTGRRVAGHSMINRQRTYGADVISRIRNAGEGKLEALHQSICEDILQGIEAMCAGHAIDPARLYRVVVAGNTTMLHLLLRIPCVSLGRVPFTPSMTAKAEYLFDEVFGRRLLDAPVTILPSISAYVGADITSGMFFCGAGDEKPSLLIDLGTNGEMAVFWKDQVICTSTAAGPAFEGGNISCGTGSIPGAVAKARLEGRRFAYETIGGKEPVGICGSGVMDVVAELARAGVIDETGLLDEDYFDEGFPIDAEGRICFTQKDVRELQLAKAAVRAGVEVLLDKASLTYEDVGRVYLAGGFGSKVDINSAAAIGLIPEALKSKVTAVGNSSLGGCVRTLLEGEEEIESLARRAQEINLSNDKRFNDLYIEHMCFDA